MVSINTRILLFNLVCIPVRIGILLLVYYFPKPETIALTASLSLGFLYKYFHPTTIGAFGGKVFWSRIFHFTTYLIASLLLIFEETREYAFWALAVDIIVGFLMFWNHYGLNSGEDSLKSNKNIYKKKN